MATKRREATAAELSGQPGPGRMAPRLETLDGACLGLLSTGKRNCDELLSEIAAVLSEEHRFAEVRSWRKSSVYKNCPQRKLDEIAQQCDAVVAGVGDLAFFSGFAAASRIALKSLRLGIGISSPFEVFCFSVIA